MFRNPDNTGNWSKERCRGVGVQLLSLLVARARQSMRDRWGDVYFVADMLKVNKPGVLFSRFHFGLQYSAEVETYTYNRTVRP